MIMRVEDIDSKIGMPDIDKEWARFEAEVINEKSVAAEIPLFRRIAAVATILISLSCIAVASVWVGKHFDNDTTKKEDTAPVITNEKHDTYIAEESSDTSPEIFLFDNVEFQEIAITLGKYYGVEPVFENEKVKHVRMYIQIDKGESIEQIVDMLNHFRKVNVRLEGKKLIVK